MTAHSAFVPVNARSLRQWPLPTPDADDDKEARGRVLIIGGSSEMPGSIVLAGEAALRAGAGKLCVATASAVAHFVALALPEARVIGLAETKSGGLSARATDALDVDAMFDAALIGPGMQDEPATCQLVRALLPRLARTALVLDASAMSVVRVAGGKQGRPFTQSVVLTPHAGEMAHLVGASKQDVIASSTHLVRKAAACWNAVVALKGATTFVAAPDGRAWRHNGANVGLAVSGSGDVLSGIVAALAARGASPEQAAVWGVALHAGAGARLARRYGPFGYLARELGQEIPPLMHALVKN